MKTLKEEQQDWRNENMPLGKNLGYPECCIKAFCDQSPAMLKLLKTTKFDELRYKAGCINGRFTGFIPCYYHADKILSGKITLASLIKNRNSNFPTFPNFNNYDNA